MATKKATLSDTENLAVGALGGILETGIQMPLITYKITSQDGRPMPKNIQGWYRGVVANAGAVAPITAFQMAVNGGLERLILAGDTSRELQAHEKIGAAMGAGAISSILYSPLDLVVIQQQKLATSIGGALSAVTKEHGMAALFRGFTSCAVRESIYTAGYLGVGSTVLAGSGPFQKLAISAIQANIVGNHERDVAMMATTTSQKEASDILQKTGHVVEDQLSNMDRDTKATVMQVENAVALKARELRFRKARDMAGVTLPMGFFDPIGFSADSSEGRLLFFREVEVKHGRVAMLASLGMLVGEQFHPLFGGNIDVPSYIAFQETPLQNFWLAVTIAVAIPEIFSVQTFERPLKGALQWDHTWSMKADHQPGDLGFDPLGLKPKDPVELKEMQTKELNNGRLAMIAAAGMIAQEVVTGQKLF